MDKEIIKKKKSRKNVNDRIEQLRENLLRRKKGKS